MKDDLFLGGAVLAAAGGLLLVIGWLIGAQGYLKLISNYRAHPERYPDGPGLGRWTGWTLALGGVSFLLCGACLMTGVIGEPVVGPWVLATAAGLLAGAFSGLARYRRMPPPAPPASAGQRPRRR